MRVVLTASAAMARYRYKTSPVFDLDKTGGCERVHLRWMRA